MMVDVTSSGVPMEGDPPCERAAAATAGRSVVGAAEVGPFGQCDLGTG
jgi:hypothetical protein